MHMKCLLIAIKQIPLQVLVILFYDLIDKCKMDICSAIICRCRSCKSKSRLIYKRYIEVSADSLKFVIITLNSIAC